ncbi:hypothetical protein ILYODFUR_018481 [Ilyodon furcidens]|uniref:Uncharacterized protein n=1 Tax=Ilyodon furcidens TaxID=33524 RepID=A0ABV0TC30_9TELE
MEQEKEAEGGVGGRCMALSILGGSRSAGGGALQQECRALSACTPPFLHFAFFFLSLSLFIPLLRLGVSAPVCLLFEPSGKRANKFVCFDDCASVKVGGRV